jgi:hypothetical protein
MVVFERMWKGYITVAMKGRSEATEFADELPV